MNKILITGGAGFIGTAILKNKKFSKFKLKVIDRFFLVKRLSISTKSRVCKK